MVSRRSTGAPSTTSVRAAHSAVPSTACRRTRCNAASKMYGLNSLAKSTNVLDGDFSLLRTLPRLRSVSFVDRPNYSHSEEDLATS